MSARGPGDLRTVPRIAIVGHSGHAMVCRIHAELIRRQRDVTVISPDLVVAEVRADELVVHPFCDGGPFDFVMLAVSTDQIAALHGVAALHEETGVPVANAAAAVLRAADKFATAQILARAGVRVPWTVSVCTESAALAQGERLGYPFVVKAADGSEGVQVSLVTGPGALAEEIARIRASLGMHASVHSSLVLQELVGRGQGRDRRLFVAGGRVQAAMDRVARVGEWRSNMSQGATPVAAEPSRDEISIAERAAQALGLAFGTVDLMYDSHGPVVIEANPFGDVLDVAMMSGIDLVGALVDLAEVGAGLRPDTPIIAWPLAPAERAALSDFCWDRLQRKIDTLPDRGHASPLHDVTRATD